MYVRIYTDLRPSYTLSYISPPAPPPSPAFYRHRLGQRPLPDGLSRLDTHSPFDLKNPLPRSCVTPFPSMPEPPWSRRVRLARRPRASPACAAQRVLPARSDAATTLAALMSTASSIDSAALQRRRRYSKPSAPAPASASSTLRARSGERDVVRRRWWGVCDPAPPTPAPPTPQLPAGGFLFPGITRRPSGVTCQMPCSICTAGSAIPF